MYRIVLSMAACMIWAIVASSGLVGIGWVIIAGIGIIPAALGTMHLVLTEWEEELIHP